MSRTTLILTILAASLAACGGPDTTDEPAPIATNTAGGEAEPEPEPEPEVEHPIRTTTPVPVPQPAVAREELSAPLQGVWTGVEEAVAIRPPDGPAEATEEAIEAWAAGAFREWIDSRTVAQQALVTASQDVPADPPHERSVASALVGYSLEDFVADIRSSPIPAGITEDPELLTIYVETLMEVLRPIATQSVLSYAYCQQHLAPLGDESPWLPWRAYCVQRGQDVIQTYQLNAGASAPQSSR